MLLQVAQKGDALLHLLLGDVLILGALLRLG